MNKEYKIVNSEFGHFTVIKNDSVVSKSMELYGEWAKNELCEISKFIKDTDTVLDVGAFIGTHTIYFSSLVCNGKVISFEARKDIYDVLKINSDKLSNVTVINSGIGKNNYKIEIEHKSLNGSDNFGGLDLKPIDKLEHKEVEIISINKLDSYDLEKVDFIKVDVEGMEYDVLLGAENIINKNRPVIFLELNDVEHGSNLLSWAKNNNYNVYGISTLAYNKNNFNNNQENIFSNASEIGLLFIDSNAENYNDIAKQTLSEIYTLDDIVLLLLTKIQYPYEILAKCKSANKLGISYYSPIIAEIIGESNYIKSILKMDYKKDELSLSSIKEEVKILLDKYEKSCNLLLDKSEEIKKIKIDNSTLESQFSNYRKEKKKEINLLENDIETYKKNIKSIKFILRLLKENILNRFKHNA
ncbi:FkbM family methyltransferase [Photobacterium damselae subsp. damselae]|uniref:FkbM family methyltransferase n=1 Tax=Photobacterium damselae subsp. damselae TaxID=85581 RepID=A0A850QN12_PHODD|nr:FkbM family methyltransferase [Photobacterium damselae subsp. damselae]